MDSSQRLIRSISAFSVVVGLIFLATLAPRAASTSAATPIRQPAPRTHVAMPEVAAAMGA